MMTFTELKDILQQIKCSVGGMSWNVYAATMGSTGFYIQLRYVENDIETGDPADQHGRKWYVSAHSTKSEVVQTVLKACLTSAEHMVREHFTYQGVRVFGPHFDVDQLVGLALRGPLGRDVRTPAEKNFGH